MKYQSSNTKLIYDIDFDQTSKRRYKCPECSGNRKKTNQKDLEFYPDTQRAFCFHCETTFYEYKPYEPKKTYTIPERRNTTKLTDKALKYFESRMISQKTLNKMGIYSDTEWMPQLNMKTEVMCFPYFRAGELINIKYRGGKKTFKLVSGAELIWYNFDQLIENDEIIIVEGEFDLLSFVENGYDNVISPPNGAKIKSEFLDSSINLFENKKVYLATDCDTPGIEFRDELIRRIGAENCFLVNFKDCKDANEYLIKYGGLEFKNLLKNANEVPIKGNISVGSLYNEIVDLYENGIQCGFKIGIDECDKYCTWELGRLAVVTGRPGVGKSEVIDQFVVNLNMNYGWKAAYFTPENYPLKFHYAKIHEKISGGKFDSRKNNTNFESVYEYIQDNFFYIMNEDDVSVESVIKSAKAYVKQKGIKILVIDPYNRLEHQINKGETETQYISRFLDTLTNFARFNNVLIFLMAHPVKLQGNEVPTLYNISGSANFYNKTDYGLTIHRPMNEDNLMSNEVEIHWQKIKFKHLGSQGVSQLCYNINNGRINDVGVYDNRNYLSLKFGYENDKEENLDYQPDARIEPNYDFYTSETPEEEAPF